MIRIAIVDDENIICSGIERMICEYCSAMHLKTDVDIFNSGESILKHLHNHTQYHLIFLDIELVQCNGIDVAHLADRNGVTLRMKKSSRQLKCTSVRRTPPLPQSLTSSSSRPTQRSCRRMSEISLT